MKWSIVLLAFLAGCVYQPSKESLVIKQVPEEQVQACHYLGNVFGTSGYTNLALDFGEQNARNEALNRAANLGATHVVWQGITKEWNTDVSVAAGAYRCG